MAARVHVRSRATHEENPKGQSFPVWDDGADPERNYELHARRVEDQVLDVIRDEGPITQYALWQRLIAGGMNDPRQARLSMALLVLRREGAVKSERDGLARKSPRAKPFFSPEWQVA